MLQHADILIQAVTSVFLTDDTNGTSASSISMEDSKGLLIDVLFQRIILASGLLSFSWSLFAVTQDLTSVVQS